ncbi:MAG: hypothetical protein A2632_03085 [Candidatus Pacebacteria bacterium RIFCSPHIGHO2_01_FULL_46_16]|nr:MAG: hypothetical protein A2632_03085 [Candidatus Pacebacteria bacterium RIFCSPHIGHO2_01_FULL_46_16]OGJ38971.1 MAG: hypothetical protein A3A82_02400 [Candidatus Pacebacteria bacterium RIFCSPLOWO2_01_FULL_47_12]
MSATLLLEHAANANALPIQLRLLRFAQTLDVPIAPTLYIPPELLFETFVVQTNIAALLRERTTCASDPATVSLVEAKVLQLFKQEQLAASLARTITATYHQTLLASFVRLFSTKPIRDKLAQPYENISGDNNLLESVQLVANELLEQALIASRKTNTLVLAAASGICVQTQLQAHNSGTICSKHPVSPEKNVLTICAQLGVRSDRVSPTSYDWYKVHQSTLQEIAAQIGKKETYYKRATDCVVKTAVAVTQQHQRILNREQTTHLARLLQKISQTTFLSLVIEWEQDKEVLLITQINEQDMSQTSNNHISELEAQRWNALP